MILSAVYNMCGGVLVVSTVTVNTVTGLLVMVLIGTLTLLTLST